MPARIGKTEKVTICKLRKEIAEEIKPANLDLGLLTSKTMRNIFLFLRHLVVSIFYGSHRKLILISF